METRLTEMLIRHEGVRYKPYRCIAGKLTIGVGRNLEDVGISEDEAIFLLKNDIARVGRELEGALSFWSNLSLDRQLVLLDMCFNLGLAGLIGFKRMLAAVESVNYEKAADEMLDSKWARQVGSRSTELAEMMRGG